MKISKNQQKNQYAAYQLILNSPAPKKLFSKYGRLLKEKPQLFAAAGVISYERSADMGVAKLVLAQATARDTFESRLLARYLELNSFVSLQKKLASVSLTGKSDKATQKSLVERIRLIKQLEKKSQEAIKKRDTSLQLILLAQVHFENSRLVQDIMTLPTPKGLNADQKRFYQEQIQLQVKPYLSQSVAVKDKVTELWETASKQGGFRDLFDLGEERSKPGSVLARFEIEKLKMAAETAGLKQDPFITFTRERHKVASEASKVQKHLVEDPFNFNEIEKYKSLQKQLGRGPMVAYLESRIEGLQSRGGRN